MKKISVAILALALFSCSQQAKQEEIKEIMSTETIEETPQRVLRHVVMFKFKDESSDKDVQSVIDAFANLPNEISEIKDFEWGTNNSPENLNQGLTHCFTLTFYSEEDRETYLPHPAHKAFGAILGPHLDKVTVVDYWTNN
jgi:hypothetical protein